MVRPCLFVLLSCLPFPCFAAEPFGGKKDNLHVLAIAFNQQGGDAHVNDYNCFPPEIEKVFREQGNAFYRKLNTRQILGKQGTYAGLMDGLGWLRKNAGKDDMVVLYLTCHGFNDADKGWGVETIDKKTFWGSTIKTELARLPCHALVLIETCTSGGFAHAHKNDPPVPANVTAICACSGKQSTDNQLDIALAEALHGRADFNRDGIVELDEVIRYIQLRYKEWWPEPTTTAGSQTPVMIKAKSLTGSLALTKASPAMVGVVHNGTWYSAINEKQTGNSFQVHLPGWASKPGPYFLTNSVGREMICLPADGKPMLVEQNGRWYPARLLKMEGMNYKVHYLGYNEQESVAKSRVFYPFAGDPAHPNFPYSTGMAGAWGRLGPAGGWKDTRAGAVLNDRLYTVENSGALYVTDLSNGVWKQLGKPDFAATAFMFAAGNDLYTIETDGSLYRVNPRDGTWGKVGAPGGWKPTLAGAIFNGVLFTAEPNGCLYATAFATGAKKQVGKAEFGNTTRMFAAGESLYTIEQDGSLFRINPQNGGWVRVGREGDWKGTIAGTVLKGKLYTVEVNGALYATNLGNGEWKALGKPEFAGTAFMFAAGSKVFTIEKDGSLFWVNLK
jgi:hypothetical protein